MRELAGSPGEPGRHRLQAAEKHYLSSESMAPTSPSQTGTLPRAVAARASTCKAKVLRLAIKQGKKEGQDLQSKDPQLNTRQQEWPQNLKPDSWSQRLQGQRSAAERMAIAQPT